MMSCSLEPRPYHQVVDDKDMTGNHEETQPEPATMTQLLLWAQADWHTDSGTGRLCPSRCGCASKAYNVGHWPGPTVVPTRESRQVESPSPPASQIR